jgi:hypothetical protein
MVNQLLVVACIAKKHYWLLFWPLNSEATQGPQRKSAS